MLSKTDTAYPQLKFKISKRDLELCYTPTNEELDFCRNRTRGKGSLLGFVVMLKTFQRLGYFVKVIEVPEQILLHIAAYLNISSPKSLWKKYEKQRVRENHLHLIREYLNVKSYSDGGNASLEKGLRQAVPTREDLADIINMGIEILVRDRFELPSFNTILRKARSLRASVNNDIFSNIYSKLGDAERQFLDSLFISDKQMRISPWNELKADSPKPTLYCLRDLLKRREKLTELYDYAQLLREVSYTKVEQLAIEAQSLNATEMTEVSPAKRYVLALALLRRRYGKITDDLCDVFCKQMRKVKSRAEEKLEHYIKINQQKTDEVLRRFANISDTLESDLSEKERLEIISTVVLSS